MALGAAVQAGILEGQVSDVMVLDVWQASLMRAFAKQWLKQDGQLAADAGLDPEQLDAWSDDEVRRWQCFMDLLISVCQRKVFTVCQHTLFTFCQCTLFTVCQCTLFTVCQYTLCVYTWGFML